MTYLSNKAGEGELTPLELLLIAEIAELGDPFQLPRYSSLLELVPELVLLDIQDIPVIQVQEAQDLLAIPAILVPAILPVIRGILARQGLVLRVIPVIPVRAILLATQVIRVQLDIQGTLGLALLLAIRGIPDLQATPDILVPVILQVIPVIQVIQDLLAIQVIPVRLVIRVIRDTLALAILLVTPVIRDTLALQAIQVLQVILGPVILQVILVILVTRATLALQDTPVQLDIRGILDPEILRVIQVILVIPVQQVILVTRAPVVLVEELSLEL